MGDFYLHQKSARAEVKMCYSLSLCLNFKENRLLLHKTNCSIQYKHVVFMVRRTVRSGCKTVVIKMKYELKSVDCRRNKEVRAKKFN